MLNDDPHVAAETRLRVRGAIAQLRFQPDAMARSLRGGRDTTVGMIVESVSDPFFAALVDAVEVAMSAVGRSVLIASTHRDSVMEREVIERMLQRRVSGLLVCPTGEDQSWLGDALASVVFVDRRASGVDADFVDIDDRGAAAQAVTHLADHGHRRIAYIGDTPAIATSAARLDGYRKALTERGIAIDEQLVRADCPTAGSAGQAVAALLSLSDPPSAFFSAATRCSLGVVPALHVCRRTDVALIGFGDFAMADALTPAITVIDHCAQELGRLAAARLLARISDPQLPAEHIQLPVRLIERGSGELKPAAGTVS